MPGTAKSAEESVHGQHDKHRARHVERLFRDHSESLLRFLMVKLCSEQDAHEVAQEAYVRLLNLESSDGVSFFRAYLFKVANNLAIDRIRQQARVQRHQATIPNNIWDESPSAEEEAAAAEKIERIRQYAGELPAKCCKAFLLRRFHRLSVQDIARQLHVSERMVRNYLRHSLQYCRRRLDQDTAQERID